MTAVIVNDVHRSNPNVNIADTVLALNDTWEAFTGSAIRGGINKQAGRLMTATQIAMLAGSGLAQLGELSMVMARHMVNGGMRNMPIIGEMATLARTNPDSPLLKSIAAAGGPLWDNMLLHSPDIRLDWEGTISNRAGKIIDRSLAIGQGWMSTASGLRKITSYQRRLASVLESDALVRLAHDGLPTDAKALRRLEAMGLSFGSGGNWDSIADALRAHSKFDQRGVLTDIDFDAMPEGTRNDLLFIIKRSVGQQIQESFIGETPTAMNSTIGKMFGQFRSYPLLAMDKQASRQFAIGDTEAYVSVMMGLLVNAMIAPARMALAGHGEDINAGTIAAQALQYLPYVGLLPDALNVLASVGVVPDSMALMNWGQEQERNISLVDTVAPVSLQYGYKLLRMPEILGERASPWTEKDELSASDIRALRGSAPLGSLPGIGLLTSAVLTPNN